MKDRKPPAILWPGVFYGPHHTVPGRYPREVRKTRTKVPETKRDRRQEWFDLFGEIGYFLPPVGVWRSLVAHLHGVQGVASSNLVTPTIKKGLSPLFLFSNHATGNRSVCAERRFACAEFESHAVQHVIKPVTVRARAFQNIAKRLR